MGNMWSEGLISPNGSVMRYSLYGTLSKIKHEKSLQEQNELVNKKLIDSMDTNNKPRESGISITSKSGKLRNSRRRKEKMISQEVGAMLSQFKL